MAPTHGYLYDLLHSYYFSSSEESRPVIAVSNAATLSTIYTILYVLPFYLFAQTRPSPTLSRDAPSVIRARIRSVSCSCAFATLATIYLIVFQARASVSEAARLLGWWPINILDIIKCVLLTATLFLGPLFERGIVEGEWKGWIRGRKVAETLGGWMGWRNFVAGPITEEILFRSVLIPLHLLANISPTHIILYTPLYFGIAHIHHFYEFTLTHPHTPLLPALARSLFQFTYTTLFGWYATFLYLRTSSLYAVILVHAFCNWCGLPRLWGRVEAGEEWNSPLTQNDDFGNVAAAAGLRGKDDDERIDNYNLSTRSGELHVGWTVGYYILLVAGAVGFWKGLWVLTESKSALAKVG